MIGKTVYLLSAYAVKALLVLTERKLNEIKTIAKILAPCCLLLISRRQRSYPAGSKAFYQQYNDIFHVTNA